MAVGGAKGYGPGTRSVGQFKQAFFDPSKVIAGMDRATARALSRFGAFVRQRAKSSIRYRKDPAPPGSPPSAHKTASRLKTNRKTGATKRQASSPLRDLIFFAYDREKKEVIVGPAIFPSAKRKGVPERLEKGGSVSGTRREKVPGAQGRDRRGQFVALDRRTRLVRATLRYEPRPFMRPAFDAEIGKVAGFFKNSL
jgi:hypothetical protein